MTDKYESPWVYVGDRLPPEGEEVIVYGRMKYSWEKRCEYFTGAAMYVPWDGGWDTWNDWYEGQDVFEVLYWYEAPDPPMTIEIVKKDEDFPPGVSIKPYIPPMRVKYTKDEKKILFETENKEAD